MAEISDGFMNEMRAKAKGYSVVILKKGPNYEQDKDKNVIWEHGRRNHALRADGIMPIVCPILDNSEYAGISVLDCPIEEAAKIMEGDPAVKASVLTFEVHPSRSFPGDTLPE